MPKGLSSPARTLLGTADRLRLFGELVPESIDQPGADLTQPIAVEEPLEVSQAPLVVVDRVLVEPEALRTPPRMPGALFRRSVSLVTLRTVPTLFVPVALVRRLP